jgi:exosortase B
MDASTDASPKLDVRWERAAFALGFLAMYIPSYVALFQEFWKKDNDSQGPIILIIVLWLLYRDARHVSDSPSASFRLAGTVVFGIGLLLYIVGRSQEFFQFDLGSQPFVLCGLALAVGGPKGLQRVWFPACFLFFLVPIPPSLLDQVLVPLKVTVSEVVTNGLYAIGYPISRSGVLLVIGQYQLLIADACSGLRSMLALSGIGVLYIYLLKRPSYVLNVTLLALTIPIAFLANVVRVTVLVLVTYYLGAQAGTDFHDYAGIFEVVVAFGSFFLIDHAFTKISNLQWQPGAA